MPFSKLVAVHELPVLFCDMEVTMAFSRGGLETKRYDDGTAPGIQRTLNKYDAGGRFPWVGAAG